MEKEVGGWTIQIPDDECDTLFYVARNKWSPEYPDAYKFNTKCEALNYLANIQRMYPFNDRYQKASVF